VNTEEDCFQQRQVECFSILRWRAMSVLSASHFFIAHFAILTDDSASALPAVFAINWMRRRQYLFTWHLWLKNIFV